MRLFTSQKINIVVFHLIKWLFVVTGVFCFSLIFISADKTPTLYDIVQFIFKYGKYFLISLIILILLYLSISGSFIGHYTTQVIRSNEFVEYGIDDETFANYLQNNIGEFKWLMNKHVNDPDFVARYIVFKIKLSQADNKVIYQRLEPIQLELFIEKFNLDTLLTRFYKLEKNWNEYQIDLINKQKRGFDELFDKTLNREIDRGFLNHDNINTIKQNKKLIVARTKSFIKDNNVKNVNDTALALYHLAGENLTPESAALALGFNPDRTALININKVMQNEIDYEDVQLNLKKIERDPKLIVALNETKWQWKPFDCFANLPESQQIEFNRLIQTGNYRSATDLLIAKLNMLKNVEK